MMCCNVVQYNKGCTTLQHIVAQQVACVIQLVYDIVASIKSNKYEVYFIKIKTTSCATKDVQRNLQNCCCECCKPNKIGVNRHSKERIWCKVVWVVSGCCMQEKE